MFMKNYNLYFKKTFFLIFIFTYFNNSFSFSQDILFNHQGEIYLNKTNIINKKFDARLTAMALNKKFRSRTKVSSINQSIFRFKYNFKRKGITLHGKSKNEQETSNCFFIIFDFKKNKNLEFELFQENLNSEFHLDDIYTNKQVRNRILKRNHRKLSNSKKTYLIIDWNKFSIYLIFDSKSKLLSAIYINMHDRIINRIYNF